jgi:hypothetical protein
MNSIAAKNNTIIALHFDDEEHGSERLAPYDELHGDDTPVLHRATPPPPHAVKRQVGLHEFIVLPSKLTGDRVRHQIDGNTAVDEHPGDGLPIDVTLNVQRLQVLA